MAVPPRTRTDLHRHAAPLDAGPPERGERAERGVPRRLVPAGQALVVMAIALVLAAFLNARGMHKTAAEQPPGTGRDIAMALTGGLQAVSGALLLDEPRKALKAALGRSSDDTVSGRIHFARHRRPRAQHKRPTVYTPAHPLRLYVTGDSLITDPGKTLLENVAGNRAIHVVSPVDTHPATGLSQPEIFNWFEYLPGQIKSLHPDLSVITFGGNDGLALSGSGGGQQFGTPEWVREYGRRVGGVMDDFIAGGSKLIWIGLPIPRDGDLAKRFQIMNSVYRAEARRRPGEVYYLDIYRRFADHNGNYADYLPDSHGHLALMREPDGIHYQIAGAQVVADLVTSHFKNLVRLAP